MIRAQAMDSEYVSIVDVSLPKEWFASYTCDGPVDIGVNLIAMQQVLQESADHEPLRATYVDGDILSFMFADPSVLPYTHESTISRTVVMTLVDVESDERMPVRRDYDIVIHMPSAVLMEICDELEDFDYLVSIYVDRDGNVWMASGDREINLAERLAGVNEATITVSHGVMITFLLSSVKLFSERHYLREHVTLKIARESPLMVQFALEGGGSVVYQLAPRIIAVVES